MAKVIRQYSLKLKSCEDCPLFINSEEFKYDSCKILGSGVYYRDMDYDDGSDRRYVFENLCPLEKVR